MYKNCSKFRVERDIGTLCTCNIHRFFFLYRNIRTYTVVNHHFLLGNTIENTYLVFFNREYQTLAFADLF